MKRPVKPYSLKATVAIGLLVATAFTLLSLFFLFLQAQGTYDRLTGEIVELVGNRLELQNARGAVTVMTIPPHTEVHGLKTDEALVEGQHIMTRGRFADDGTFVVDRLRVLRDFTPK
ncbi:hypothetical protein [Marivita sp. S2033]|uniref:hypothetical protein n=1 Tax=Marivita sp. S2033 TaxID=3373187 RepID=UPI003982AC91